MTLHPLVLLTLFVFAATFGLALALVPLFARVALACGFASQGLFARLYRKRYGETPSVTAGKRRR